MKSKWIILSICIIILLLFGVANATWIYSNPANISSNIGFSVPQWTFEDHDFSLFDNVVSCTNATATKETSLTLNSVEAIKMTSTTGTSSKDHTITINFDRDYTVGEVKYCKFEFDYHHRYKREQYNKGFPTVQFMYNNTNVGSVQAQGNTDTCTEKSAFVATPINDEWWHLEYFVFANIPTLAKHSDTPISTTKTINRVKINDKTIYDYAGTTAFVVIDNMKFSTEPTSRLGIFNRTSGDTAGKVFWFKVAFAGELHSVKLYSSDENIAVPEFDPTDTTSTTTPFPNGSPFYFQLLTAGNVTLTAVLEVGDDHQEMIISNTITVT